MPVGTGSINRAARSSKKTIAAEKSTAAVVKAVEVKQEVEAVSAVPEKTEAVQENATPKKATPKKPATKRTVAKKAAAPKTAAVKETAEEEVAAEKAPELIVYGNETVFVVGNECCCLTEELPVHLL